MGRSYRLIFNRSLALWQVVSELAKSRGKRGGARTTCAISAPFSPSITFAGGCTVGSLLSAAGLLMAPEVQAQPPCSQNPDSAYVCSGAATLTATVMADDASVSTAPGFSIDTTASGGNALVISGAGAISYIDVNSAALSAANADDD
ncbi:MAG: ESPR domain-containing protein, partial [Azoarcus sp.]|nr:ESPR domain-containing protein [Azoarcus sp.]